MFLNERRIDKLPANVLVYSFVLINISSESQCATHMHIWDVRAKGDKSHKTAASLIVISSS